MREPRKNELGRRCRGRLVANQVHCQRVLATPFSIMATDRDLRFREIIAAVAVACARSALIVAAGDAARRRGRVRAEQTGVAR
jgi:hypothetical protein